MNNSRDASADFYRTSKFDLFLIIVLFGLAVLPLAGTLGQRLHLVSGACRVMVYQENKLLTEADLKKNATLPVLDGKMMIEIRQGRVRVLSSNCPQHICMHTGWIQYAGQTIVCVPNHILIEVKSTAPQLVDAVAY